MNVVIAIIQNANEMFVQFSWQINLFKSPKIILTPLRCCFFYHAQLFYASPAVFFIVLFYFFYNLDALPTANFQDFKQGKKALDHIRSLSKDFPMAVMEFWCGWFDHWGESHQGHSSSGNVK